LESNLAVGLVQVIDVVLLLAMERLLSGVLTLENFCENTFGVSILVWCASTSLNIYTSTMDAVELIFNVSRGPWRSLPSCTSWIASSLSYRWP
jgi:hypothetical protein